MKRKFRLKISMPSPVRGVGYLLHVLINWQRSRFRNLDYVLFSLPQTITALPEPRDWLRRRLLGNPPLSLLDLDRAFERIADDPRPKGVILHLRGLSLSLADLQTLRGSILRLRKKGKRVVCFAQGYDNAAYYIASAADTIILQPGGLLNTLGLRTQLSFFRTTLDTLGVQLEAVAISPYKGAYDTFTLDTISAEGRAQLEWLLDSRYDVLLEGIAEGRGWTVDQTRAMIDTAPHLDDEALTAKYVDALLHEEQLPEYLGVKHIVLWTDAERKLRKKWRKRYDQYVALLPLTGMIIPGESGGTPVPLPIPLPFLGNDRLGDLTVVRQVRNLIQNKRAAAVVLWIDSPGGSADASEAMSAALDELAKDRPVVAYMNGVAASGGYHISTPARWIVAQPGTLTGSIGVLFGKVVSRGLFEHLKVNRLEFTRGANATIFSDNMPFTEPQREQVRRIVERVYRQFLSRVARSRSMTPEAVDAVAGGRVWTGQQALHHGLVDELGDWRAAVAKARELAGLPEGVPVAILHGGGKPIAPQANPAAALQYLRENLTLLTNRTALLLPLEWN